MKSSRSRLLVVGLSAGVCVLMLGLAPQSPRPSPPDTAKIADTIVNQCAGLHSGELVLVEGGPRDIQLLEDIAVTCQKLGAQPVITLGSDRLTRRLYTDVPAKFDSQEPTFWLKMADTIHAVIDIDYSEQPGLLSDIDPQRITAHAKAHEAVHNRMLERDVVHVHLGNNLYPTKARAEMFGIPETELAHIFWDGVNVDYRHLQAIGANVRTKLDNGKTIQITAPNGTDLSVQITERPVFVSDGVVSSEDRAQGGPACQVWLPAGEVYVTAVPNTARGTFVADTFYFEGQPIQGLTFKFENGKCNSISAKGDWSKLKARWDAAPAGKDVFAAIDLGINPNIKVPANSKMVTWMAAGTISVGVGGNTWAGGDNTCPFDVFAHLTNGTLTVDGTKLIENGKLLDAK